MSTETTPTLLEQLRTIAGDIPALIRHELADGPNGTVTAKLVGQDARQVRSMAIAMASRTSSKQSENGNATVTADGVAIEFSFRIPTAEELAAKPKKTVSAAPMAESAPAAQTNDAASSAPALTPTKKFAAYVIAADGSVIGWTKTSDARTAAGEGEYVVTASGDGLSSVPMAQLVAAYNRADATKQVKNFRDRATAERKVLPVIEYLAQENITMAAKKATRKTGAAKKGSARKTTTSAAKTPRKRAEGAGRTSAFSGKRITRQTKDNPRREGTFGFKSFALIKDGMTYEDYIAKGGRRKDLDWDVKHGFVKVHN
jgi:hypothetical protein